jgi:hypothetical protein
LPSLPGAPEPYNGWPSYETWLVYLWLTNDPDTDALCRELVAHAWTPAEAAEALKSYVEEASPLVGQASLYVDLLTAVLRHVDFDEIALHFCAAL